MSLLCPLLKNIVSLLSFSLILLINMYFLFFLEVTMGVRRLDAELHVTRATDARDSVCVSKKSIF